MIKIVYPEFLYLKDQLVAGWPDTTIGKNFANQVYIGQELAIYITSPISKIVGIVKVTGHYIYVPGDRWPYQTPVEWVVGPKEGLSLQNVGIDISPGRGDTGYRIGQANVQKIKERLQLIPDMQI